MLFGGRSAEHDISCVSASHVLCALDPDRYEVVPVGITRDGRFVSATPSRHLVAAGDELALEEALTSSAPRPRSSSAALTRSSSDAPGPPHSNAGDDREPPTVVLPILHGPNGEDGTIQGLLEVAGVAYVGSGVLGSSVAMDKDMAKTVLSAQGIPQTRWRTIRSHEPPTDSGLQEILDEFGPVLFVKPANMGSSIGVTRLDAPAGTGALREALDRAFRYDDVAVIEAGVTGRELECAVIGNEHPCASVLGEVVTDAEFYDFDDKYVDGTARTVIPAELDEATMEAGRELALATFRALRCAGMARVDMFLRDDGQLLVNEANTIPGFTPISMYPKLWEASGLGYADLLDELVALALESHRSRSSRSVDPS